ncbi:MAG: hypothetical protein AMXMBFR58_15660 [Phycisphaerae bacterium]|nr:hypothetical protein [Phycisphaerales bacterium]MCK6477019.1 hypothetical protein [Phycisphaerales bacterium]
MLKIRIPLRCVIAALVAGGVQSAATADDFAPPPYRGAPLSVYAEWEFAMPPTNWYFIAPDSFDAVGNGLFELYDGFTTHAEVDDPARWTWHPGDGDGEITPAGGTGGASIAFKLQNWMDILPDKLLRIQVTWSGAAPPMTIAVDGWQGSTTWKFVQQGSQVVDPNHFYEDWRAYPNPWWDVVALWTPEGTAIDEIIIDTVCLPAPTPLAVALAGLMALGRRRR